MQRKYAEESNEDLNSSLETNHKMVDRITSITRGIRNLSYSSEEGASFEKVSSNALLQDSLALAQVKTKLAGVTLKVQPIEPLEIECDPVQISQVILNLIANSCDAVQKLNDRWIQISFTSRSQALQMIVTDSGLGIPPDVVEKLASPFFTTKSRGKGTGLGLSICRRIVEHHHGSLKYNPDFPNTQFIFTLPLRAKAQGPGSKDAV